MHFVGDGCARPEGEEEYEEDDDEQVEHDPALIAAMLEAVGDDPEMQSQVLAFANGNGKY